MPYARKSIWRYFNPMNSKLFRSRNIIVVSQGEVKHYPISASLQLFGMVAVMGALSWGSYSTGSYFAAQTILEEKERTIETTTLLNRRIEEQYGLLKRDLVKLQDKEGEMSDYERFVIAQHSATIPSPQNLTEAQLDDNGLANLSRSVLQDRVDYLEGLVEQLKTDRENLVSSIRMRTKEQITAFEDIISNTGLSLAKLAKHPEAREKLEELQTATNHPDNTEFVNQGGPYLPENPTAAMLGLEHEEEALFSDLNNMMLLSDIHQALPLSAPMKDYRQSSPFGRRVDPISKRWAIHSGLDFVGAYGAKVYSTAPGVVTFAGRHGAYGNFVEIDHGYGISTRYAHLKTITVAEGTKVKKGSVIGLQGNTGRSTGSHLHYEVRFNRAAMNPKRFIEAQKNVF